MSVEAFTPATPVAVTAAAEAHFRSQLRGSDHTAVRLAVKESGCTGFKYVVTLVDEPHEDDTRLELDSGLAVFIERSALPILQGTEIDLVREGVNRNIVFKNPNVSDQCGCGESFNVS